MFVGRNVTLGTESPFLNSHIGRRTWVSLITQPEVMANEGHRPLLKITSKRKCKTSLRIINKGMTFSLSSHDLFS